MKTNSLLLTSLLSVMLSLCPVAANAENPVYNPELKPVEAPTGVQWAAILHRLQSQDDETFIKAFIPEGMSEPDNEFTGAPLAWDAIRKVNQDALDYAKHLLNGECEFPVSIRLTLFRYNPDNKTFLTSARHEAMAFDVDFSASGQYPRRLKIAQPISPASQYRGLFGASVKSMTIANWNYFSGLTIPPELAAKLIDATKGDRVFLLKANCRVIPGSFAPSETNAGAPYVYKAEITSYTLIPEVLDIHLTDEIAKAIAFSPYERTAADIEFEKAMADRVWVGPEVTVIFKDKGVVRLCGPIGSLDPQGKVNTVGHAEFGDWYIMGGSLCIIDNYNSPMFFSPLVIEGPKGGVFRISGIPYTQETHITFRGRQIHWEE